MRLFEASSTRDPGRSAAEQPSEDVLDIWETIGISRRSVEAGGRIDDLLDQALAGLGVFTFWGYELAGLSLQDDLLRTSFRCRGGEVSFAGSHLVLSEAGAGPVLARVLTLSAGDGLEAGVLDAENLSWKVFFDANGWGGPALLGSYYTERATPPRWYGDSVLTTPDPTRPSIGAPTPGALIPDIAVGLPGRPRVRRLREVVRGGFTVLVADGRYSEKLYRAAVSVSTAPIDLVPLDGVHGGDRVVRALGMRAGEAWLIRPDACVAAVVAQDDPAALTRALLRALGHP